MIVDCDRCEVRGNACQDCVVGVLLGIPEVPGAGSAGASLPSGARSLQFDAPECRALSVLADQGLVPRLRLVPTQPRRASPNPRIGDGFSNAG